MNAALVDRLERSFEREQSQAQTVEINFGGRQMSAMFRMMAAAADLIADRIGKGSALTDYETFVAAQKPWKEIIERFQPKPARHLVDAVVALDQERQALDAEKPEPPAQPLHEYLEGLLATPKRMRKEQQAIAAEWARYQQEDDAWKIRDRDLKQREEAEHAHYRELRRIGEDAAEQLGIKPERRK
jgi:hypothetical protein